MKALNAGTLFASSICLASPVTNFSHAILMTELSSCVFRDGLDSMKARYSAIVWVVESAVGVFVGQCVGRCVGNDVGSGVGVFDGVNVGFSAGVGASVELVGDMDGLLDGADDGLTVGVDEGLSVGSPVGFAVGMPIQASIPSLEQPAGLFRPAGQVAQVLHSKLVPEQQLLRDVWYWSSPHPLIPLKSGQLALA